MKPKILRNNSTPCNYIVRGGFWPFYIYLSVAGMWSFNRGEATMYCTAQEAVNALKIYNDIDNRYKELKRNKPKYEVVADISDNYEIEWRNENVQS